MQFLQAFKPIGLDLLATIVFVAIYWLTGNHPGRDRDRHRRRCHALCVHQDRKHQPVGPLQYLSVVLVVVARRVHLVTKDPHFVEVKSSVDLPGGRGGDVAHQLDGAVSAARS